MFHIVHCCRAEGLRLTIAENDTIAVYDAEHYEVVALTGALFRRIIENYLDGVALQQRVTAEAQRPLPSPYRRSLAPPLPPARTQAQEQLALARRARKRKGEQTC